MNPQKPMTGLGVLILAAAAIGAALLAGAGVWYWQFRANADLKSDLAASQARVVDLEARLAELEGSAQATSAPAGSTAPTATTPPASSEEPAPSEPGKPTREFAFVKDINESAGKYSWVLDYAQWLTGAKAAAAAAANGDESPPPNDYYVLNESAKLRTFPVSPSAKVTVYFGNPTDKAVFSLGQYYDVWMNNTDGNGPNTGFWVTIQDGKVTAAEEQWTP